MTGPPQLLFKTGARRIIEADILERKADFMAMQYIREIENGLSQPLDQLLAKIGQDRKQGEVLAARMLH